MNFHQNIEQILAAATPEQKIMWNDIFLRYGQNCAISQYHYEGGFAGEIITYSANKLYFIYQLHISSTQIAAANYPSVLCFDAANIQNFTVRFMSSFWDTTAIIAAHSPITGTINNIITSRLTCPTLLIEYIKVTGYRIGI